MATLSPQGMAVLHPPSRRLLSSDCHSSRDSALTYSLEMDVGVASAHKLSSGGEAQRSVAASLTTGGL